MADVVERLRRIAQDNFATSPAELRRFAKARGLKHTAAELAEALHATKIIYLTPSGGLEIDGKVRTLATVKTMFRAAELVGEAIRRVYRIDGKSMEDHHVSFDVSFLMGGQIKNGKLSLFEIYSAGNFIEATQDTPYLQIGEHKYGKPILDRTARYETELYDGVKLALVSMDSTLRSNLSVGLPIDLLVYRRDSLEIELKRRITESDDYFRMLRERWSGALREAYRTIPQPSWPPATEIK